MGYIKNECKNLNVEKAIIFQFPLWDTKPITYPGGDWYINFQFPLWDTLEHIKFLIMFLYFQFPLWDTYN